MLIKIAIIYEEIFKFNMYSSCNKKTDYYYGNNIETITNAKFNLFIIQKI